MEELRPEDLQELVRELENEQGREAAEAEYHLNRAYAHESSDQFDAAWSECEAAIRLDPGLADAHNLRGIVLEELGRKQEAVAAYHQAVGFDPAFVEAWENLREAEAELRNLKLDRRAKTEGVSGHAL